MPIHTAADIYAIGVEEVNAKADVVLFDTFATLTITIGNSLVRLSLPSAVAVEEVVDAINRAMRHPRKALA
jgi:hypothetical protein